MNSVSENFRKRFVEATLLVEDGGRGLWAFARSSPPARRADVARGPRAADRVRERREPVDGAGSRSPAGIGSGSRWGLAVADRRRARREPAAVARRRRLGIVVAVWTGDLLLSALPFEWPRGLHLDARRPRAGVRALGVVLTGVLFGLVPAWQTVTPQLLSALKEEGGSVGLAGHVRLRKGLVVAQVALSLLLLVGAGPVRPQPLEPAHARPGLPRRRPHHVLDRPDAERVLGRAVAAAVRAVAGLDRARPGVLGVGLAANMPLTQNLAMATVVVDGYRPKDGEDMNPHVNWISPAT